MLSFLFTHWIINHSLIELCNVMKVFHSWFVDISLIVKGMVHIITMLISLTHIVVGEYKKKHFNFLGTTLLTPLWLFLVPKRKAWNPNKPTIKTVEQNPYYHCTLFITPIVLQSLFIWLLKYYKYYKWCVMLFSVCFSQLDFFLSC